MGWQDRPYERSYQFGGPPTRGGGFGGGGGLGRLQPRAVVTWLIVINAGVFILDAILGHSMRAAAIAPRNWGAFNIDDAILGGQVWRIITYQFLHWDFFHIFFNMLALFFFGPMVESWLGSRRFIAFYLISGVGGAALFTVLALAVPDVFFRDPALATRTALVGASGCIFGVLVAAALIAPDQRVMLLIPPIPMKLRTLVWVFLGIAVLSVVVGSVNAGGEVAHLGGAAVGFLLIRRPRLLDPFAESAGRVRQRVEHVRTDRQRKQQQADEAEIDRILAKVHNEGLNALTEKEKRTLRRATEEKRAG